MEIKHYDSRYLEYRKKPGILQRIVLFLRNFNSLAGLINKLYALRSCLNYVFYDEVKNIFVETLCGDRDMGLIDKNRLRLSFEILKCYR